MRFIARHRLSTPLLSTSHETSPDLTIIAVKLGRKQVKRHRTKLFRETLRLKKQLEEINKKYDKYKKRYNREKKKGSKSEDHSCKNEDKYAVSSNAIKKLKIGRKKVLFKIYLKRRLFKILRTKY